MYEVLDSSSFLLHITSFCDLYKKSKKVNIKLNVEHKSLKKTNFPVC